MLIVIATMMGASVITALLSLEMDLRYRMNRELRDYGPNVVLVANPSSKSPYLENSLVDSIQHHKFQNEIIAFAPQLFFPVQVNDIPTTMVGTPLISLGKLYPNWKISGSIHSDSGILAGARLARRLNLKEGETVRVQVNEKEDATKVAGIVETGESADDRIFVDLPQAQRWSGQEGQFHVVAISAIGDIPGVEKDFRSFLKDRQGVDFRVVRKIAVGETVILDKISRLISLVILIILLTLFFCINTTVSAILLSRQSEIALLRVLGARRKQILFELTLEQSILGLVGGCLGFVLGIGMAQILGQVLFETFVMPHLTIFLLAISASLIMMVISTILPIRRAVNREPALILKEA